MKKIYLAILAIIFIFLTSNVSMASSIKEAPQKKAIVLAVFGTTYPTALQSIINLKEAMPVNDF